MVLTIEEARKRGYSLLTIFKLFGETKTITFLLNEIIKNEEAR